MSKLIITLALIAVVTAEAPYYSNRPSATAPSFNYSPGLQAVSNQQPAPRPAPAPQYHAPVAAPAPQYHAPAPQYQAPAPAPQYVQYPPTVNVIPQPQPQYQQPTYNYERPSIAPAFVYQQHQLPQPVQVRQPAPQPQPAPIQLHSQPQQPQGYSYYTPLAAQQSSAASAPQAYQQQTYQQALPASNAQIAFQPQPQIQYTQSQGSSAHQFQQSQQFQTQAAAAAPSFHQQSTVLDSHVVDRLSNILAQNEDTQARNLGYYHRVSGVSLEGVSPSVELSAFVQNVPLASAHTASSQSQSVPSLHELARGSSHAQSNSLSIATAQSSGSSATGRSLSSYGLPTVVDNRQSRPESVNNNFVPSQNQLPSAYGAPN